MRVYDRNGVWYADIRTGGGRVRRRLGPGTKTEAKETAKRLAIQLGAAPVDASRSFYECLIVWLEHQPRSSTDRSILRQLRAQYPDRPAVSVTNESMRAALGNLSAGNYNRYVSTINAALRLGMEEHGLRVPRLKKLPSPRGRLRFLTRDEWLKLRAALPLHLIAPAEFALATGIRQANLFGLEWSQINMTNRTMTIWAAEAKGRKELTLPLGDWARSVLRSQIGQHSTHVFAFRGRPISSPKTAFNSAMTRAGIAGFNWHGLRHTWASWAVQEGTPLMMVQQLGGWSSLEMVKNYAHLAPSHLAQWANAVPRPRAKKGTKGHKQKA